MCFLDVYDHDCLLERFVFPCDKIAICVNMLNLKLYNLFQQRTIFGYCYWFLLLNVVGSVGGTDSVPLCFACSL